MNLKRCIVVFLFCCALAGFVCAQTPEGRERLRIDDHWSFALGDERGLDRDYNHASAPFFFGKEGYGDGPAANGFDDRGWRRVSLPHDWANDLPLDAKGTTNHGSRAIGLLFPQNSVGWYRRRLNIPASDEGRRILVDFDGIYRDATVWINGFYLGEEHSGYSPQRYDLTDYLNYGGENILVVRVDATREEGWFYEGAGIYRHAWLEKTAPTHIVDDSLFIDARPNAGAAAATAKLSVRNDAATSARYAIEWSVLDASGKVVASAKADEGAIAARSSVDAQPASFAWAQAQLWSPENPYIYKVVATLAVDGKIIDRVESNFGVRDVRFDADKGFFLNGQHVMLRGVDLHQDHTGVGVAVPDSLIEYRLERLKSFGVNAIRTAHHPASREFLDLCDRMGLMVMEEERQAGVTPEVYGQLRRMLERDRNHPSIILWSMGNEEWKLEWSAQGERVTREMQAFAHAIDPTRMTTFAMSGSNGTGVSASSEVLGFNYYRQHDIDAMHKKFPTRPLLASEESSAMHTRGVYVDDLAHQHLADYDVVDSRDHSTIEESWRYHMARPYSSGLFYWTGFDYRGETTPFDWPAIGSQFGLLDQCGFYKNGAWALRSYWTREPMAHVTPHWTWPGREGKPVDVRVYANVDEVELLLNGRSLGRKKMPENSHLEWAVKYEPGELRAVGYRAGKEVARDAVFTTGKATALAAEVNRATLPADGSTVAVINLSALDAAGHASPVADNLVHFSISGAARIIGVGNGDPSSHEADHYAANNTVINLDEWRTRAIDAVVQAETARVYNDQNWKQPDDPRWDEKRIDPPQSLFRGAFELEKLDGRSEYKLLMRSMGERQTIWVNGHKIAADLKREKDGWAFAIKPELLVVGRNVVAIAVDRFSEEGKKEQNYRWDELGPAAFVIYTPAEPYRRRLFNGLAQVIVQSTGEAGEITLTASAEGLKPVEIKLAAE